jgi:hypothetical protein
MENQTLAGTLVLVKPDLEIDPDAKRGQIGVLTYARSETENYVRFPDGGEAFYPAAQVMMLKDKQEIFNDLTSNGSSMPLDDFKAIYKLKNRNWPNLIADENTDQLLPGLPAPQTP